ncbi:hypothetical protein CWE12_06625 [Aliidiomarina sedimenti]|uniref:DUF1439 domain-containing protein n=2 Tax=Aliidiomarina sedimenti TaxID=1933879 RepID=A0ABY0C0G2_9GAMM|nr:hypothetical protein CWE12_06625 [Aliidiomarina sedimenti]
MIRLITVVVAGCLMTACAQMGQLINYTISEDELEQLALNELQSTRYQVDFAGLSAALNVDALELDIGQDGDGKVRVRTQSTLNATVFGQQYPVAVDLSMAGAPSYSAEHHAIFIRDLVLEDSSVETGLGSLRLNGLHTEIYRLLHDYLDEHPVYRFDQDDSRYQLLQRLGMDLVVEPGQLRIKSADRGQAQSD